MWALILCIMYMYYVVLVHPVWASSQYGRWRGTDTASRSSRASPASPFEEVFPWAMTTRADGCGRRIDLVIQRSSGAQAIFRSR